MLVAVPLHSLWPVHHLLLPALRSGGGHEVHQHAVPPGGLHDGHPATLLHGGAALPGGRDSPNGSLQLQLGGPAGPLPATPSPDAPALSEAAGPGRRGDNAH